MLSRKGNAMADNWPTGVSRISTDELQRLGINEKTGRLYWDGNEIVSRTDLLIGRVGTWTINAAAIAATAAAVTAAVNLFRLVKDLFF